MADVRTAGPKWEQWAENLDEHCPTIWEKYDWSFRGFGALVKSRILEYAAGVFPVTSNVRQVTTLISLG